MQKMLINHKYRSAFLLQYSNQRNLVLYALFGTFSASLDFCVFALLMQFFDLGYIYANIISVSCGMTLSFILNRNLNFKLKDKTSLRLVSFLIVGFTGMFLSTLILGLLFFILPISMIYLKIFSAVLVVLIQFYLNKYLTFKK
jgi:putative flippase GtrA